MITGMERLAAAVAGKAADRVPVFCNLIDQGARELGVSLRDYYSSGARVAEGQLRMREKYGHDNVWGLFYVGKEAEALGCRDILFAEDGPPNVADMMIKSPEDVHRLTIPDDLEALPALAEVLECLRILRREVGGRFPICAYATASLSLPAILVGMDRWLELLFLGPAEVRDELLAKCSDFVQRFVTVLRRAGADLVIYSNPLGSTELVPRRTFLELSLPWIERDLGPLDRAGLVYYCGLSRMGDVLGDVLEKTGLSAYYLGPRDDVGRAKATLSGRALCAGVIDDVSLIDWSPAQIRAEVKRIIDAGKPGGRFLFGTGLMPLPIPERSIRVLLEAAFEFGRQDGVA